MGTFLFWIALPSSVARPIITFIGGPISIIAGIYIFFTSSIIPSSYVWGLFGIFAVVFSPFGQAIGKIISRKIESPEDRVKMGESIRGTREKLIVEGWGDSVMGAVTGMIYHGYWLDFAQNNEGTWLIFLNWFMSSIAFWVVITSFFMGKWMKRKRENP